MALEQRIPEEKEDDGRKEEPRWPSGDRFESVKQSSPPDPEVVEKPVRRKFSAAYKLKILAEADQSEAGELGALLRREGLYFSNLTCWRRQRREGELAGLSPKKRGRKEQKDPLVKRIAELERENRKLVDRLEKAETIIEVQKKLSGLLGLPLHSPDKEDKR